MEDLPREQLKELIRRYGVALVDEPHRVGDFLEEALGDGFRREISLIETAAEERVGRELVDSSAHARMRVLGLTSRLVRERGLSRQASRWAVESWASALGIEVPFRPGGLQTRVVLSILGAVLLMASAFAPWGNNITASRIGFSILWRARGTTIHAPFFASIGFVAFVLAIVALLGLVPPRGWPTTVAGAGAVLIFILFLITHSLRAHFSGSELDFGVFLLLSSVVAAPAGFIGVRPPTPPGSPRTMPRVPWAPRNPGSS